MGRGGYALGQLHRHIEQALFAADVTTRCSTATNDVGTGLIRWYSRAVLMICCWISGCGELGLRAEPVLALQVLDLLSRPERRESHSLRTEHGQTDWIVRDQGCPRRRPWIVSISHGGARIAALQNDWTGCEDVGGSASGRRLPRAGRSSLRARPAEAATRCDGRSDPRRLSPP